MTDYQIPEGMSLPELPDIDLRKDAVKAPPFLGRVIVSEYRPHFYNGKSEWRWHWGVQDIDHPNLRYSRKGSAVASNGEGSLMQKAMKEFKAIFPNLFKGDEKIDVPILAGSVAYFEMRAYPYGKNISPSKPVPIPVGKANGEEIARAENTPTLVEDADDNGERAAAEQISAPSVAVAYTDEQLTLAASVYDGSTEAAVTKAAMRDPKFHAEIRRDLASGALLRTLVERDLVEVGTDGAIRALVTA